MTDPTLRPGIISPALTELLDRITSREPDWGALLEAGEALRNLPDAVVSYDETIDKAIQDVTELLTPILSADVLREVAQAFDSIPRELDLLDHGQWDGAFRTLDAWLSTRGDE